MKNGIKYTIRKSVTLDASHVLDLCRNNAPKELIEAALRSLYKEAYRIGGKPKVFINGKEVDYTPYHKENRLNHICVICGHVPSLKEKLEDVMESPWHCIFCECPECGKPSYDIKLEQHADGFWLACKCGWALPVGLKE